MSVSHAPPKTQISLRWAALAVFIVVVELAALLLVWRVAEPKSAAGNAPHTIWQKITSGIRDGSVPKDVALEAFAYLYRVDIPGVTVPKGDDAADKPTSGTGAYSWVQANWDQLTAAQQAVVSRFVTPGPNDVMVHIDATEGATARKPVELAVARPQPAQPRRAANAPPNDLVVALTKELTKDIQHIGERLGLPVLTTGYGPFWKNVTLDVSDTDGGNTDMMTIAAENGAGHYSPCNVVVYRNRWNGQPVNNGQVSDVLHVQMTHEVVHCYQNVIWGSTTVGNGIAAWIKEGTALWLAADDTQIEEPIIPSMWIVGYFNPEIPLTNRSYDGFGYFALLNHLGRDLWGLMVPAWKAAAASLQHSNAFIAVLNGDADDVRDAWAQSYVRHTPWSDPWIAYGFGLPDAAEVFQHPVQALPEPGWTGSLPSRSNTVNDVSAAGFDIVQVDTTGLASAHDDSFDQALNFRSARFCVIEKGCKCPENTARAGEDMAPDRMESEFVAAFNAPSGGSDWDVIGYKLEDLCGRQPTPQPKPAGPGHGCGDCSGSNGDPHLHTVNHFRYDFQGAGEFTLLRSADGSVDIQAREQQFLSPSIGIATNTAVAARVNGHRVGVYVQDEHGHLQVKVDGAAVDLSTPLDLGAGGSVTAVKDGVEVDFPDGTVMWALSVGIWGINAVIQHSPALATSGVGLLGPIVKGGLGVPALPDGTRLPAAPDRHARHDTVYGPFADAWRVTDATTLFDYDAGQSTATFTDKTFPSDTQDVSFGDLPPDQVSAGESACGSITDQDLHQDCVYDVAASGQPGFSETYVVTQDLYDSGIVPVTPTPGPTSSATFAPSSPGFVVSGAIKVTDLTGVRGSAKGSGNVVYFSIGVAGGTGRIIAVEATTAQVIHQLDVPLATDIRWAGGSLFAADLEDGPGTGCLVTQFNADSLAKLATIKVPCTFFGVAQIVSNGTEIWYVDVTGVDPDGHGDLLRRLKIAPSDPDVSAALPFTNGIVLDSEGALFYGDTGPDRGIFRLVQGATTLDSLGVWEGSVSPAGLGYWKQGANGGAATDTAVFVSTDPPITVPSPGAVVGGDPTGVYMDIFGPDATDQLWRQPADGSAPTQLATAPTVDGQGLGYFNDFPAFATPDGYVQTWLPGSGGQSSGALYLQWAPLP